MTPKKAAGARKKAVKKAVGTGKGTSGASTRGKAAKTTKKAPKAAGKVIKKASRTVVTTAAPKAKRPKCPLSKRELAEFREVLLTKRRTLLGDMTGMEAEALRGLGGAGEQSSMPVHMADIGTDNYEQEFTLGLLQSERQLLREIDDALERMAQGLYGICMGTGEEIGVARLRAKPWAKYCIDYVRKIEKGMVRMPAVDYGQSSGGDDGDEDEDDL
ncbi:MAG: TraR/DksA family transcriptional regulator [Planctomycetes bacterium]|nr:TraR/DksA family transcriptional regulator [Planctomycetota bacterium]